MCCFKNSLENHLVKVHLAVKGVKRNITQKYLKIIAVIELVTQKNRNSSDIETALLEGILTDRNVLVTQPNGTASNNIWQLKKRIN